MRQVGEEWDDSLQSKEQIEAKLLQRQEAALKRERALAYAFSHQVARLPHLSFLFLKKKIYWSREYQLVDSVNFEVSYGSPCKKMYFDSPTLATWLVCFLDVYYAYEVF